MAVDLTPFRGQYPDAVLDALAALFAAKPDQEAFFLNSAGGDVKAYIDSTLGWWGENGGSISDLSSYGPEMALINALGYDVNPTSGTLNTTGGGVPLEQGVLQIALPSIINDINRDEQRRNLATSLGNQTIAGAAGAASALQRTQGGGFDGRRYFELYPDVLAEYNRQGGQQGTGLTPAQFAERHYAEFGQREGRTPAYINSAQLNQDLTQIGQNTQANIASLQQATATLQQNLTGNLAERAAALQQLTATLNQNLDTLDASQRAALTQQIASQQANLEQSIASQRQALEQQVAALGNAAGTEAQARRAALQQEIAGLTAAQAPLAQARLNAAELQATAVNVGLERTRDQLTADAARAGFVGGSTVQDANLARATVDARQRAAEAIGGARVQNAADTRDIGARGATGERSIADALAQQNREIAGVGATGNFALSTSQAQQRQRLGDTQATGLASIANNTATARAGIGSQTAGMSYNNAVFGADQRRTIGDNLATGTSTLQQQGNNAQLSAYGNDFNRTVQSGLTLAAIPTAVTGALTNLDNYGNSGLTRGLNTLNWWASGPTTAPTPGYTQQQPSTSGNDLANLGAGLTNLGLQAGRQWWTTPSTTTNPNTRTGMENAGAPPATAVRFGL